MMDKMVKFSKIVEENGKTVKENNLDISHSIPINSVVEVGIDHSGYDGSWISGKARLYVTKHTRDCDGTPLYSLGLYPKTDGWKPNVLIFATGYSEDFLKDEVVRYG